MKLLLLVVGNAAMLWGLYRWLRLQQRVPLLGPWLWPTLGLRLVGGCINALRLTDDTIYYHVWSRRLALQLWTEPGAWLRMLLTDEFHYGRHTLIFHGFSNTFFLIKLLSAFDWLTGGSLLMQALYLSAAAFGGCWLLVRVLSHLFPATRRAAIVGLLLWPSAVYWGCGVSKESLLLAGSALLLAAGLLLGWAPRLRTRRRWEWVLLGLLGAWLSFKMRFFFGGALLAMLLVAAAVQGAGQLLPTLRRWPWQLLLYVVLLTGGLQLAAEASPVFRFNKFASQLTRTYFKLRDKSIGRPHVALPDLAPTAASILQHTPKAVASTLYRPFAWEGDTVVYGLAALENMGLLLLTLAALVDALRRRPGTLPFLVTLLLLSYCLTMAALVGLSTPNLGTLSRYRAPWLPLLVYWLLSLSTAGGWLRRLEAWRWWLVPGRK